MAAGAVHATSQCSPLSSLRYSFWATAAQAAPSSEKARWKVSMLPGVAAGKPSVNRVQDAGERYLDTMANMTAREPSLLEFLLEQWGVVELDEPLRAFGEYLIGNLDHNGRLQSTLAEVVQVYGRQVTTEESLDVLRLIQQLGAI